MANQHSIIGAGLFAGCLFLVLVAILPGCASGPDEGEVKTIADMQVRAIELREQRFALANEIRFTQDTLLAIDSTGARAGELEATLKVLAARKDSLLTASLTLADSIKHRLDSAIDPERYSQEERATFNEKLNEEIKRRGVTVTGS